MEESVCLCVQSAEDARMRKGYVPTILGGFGNTSKGHLSARQEIANVFKQVINDAERNSATRVSFISYLNCTLLKQTLWLLWQSVSVNQIKSNCIESLHAPGHWSYILPDGYTTSSSCFCKWQHFHAWLLQLLYVYSVYRTRFEALCLWGPVLLHNWLPSSQQCESCFKKKI